MQKYQRPQRRSVKSSIPLSNPRKIAWYRYAPDNVVDGDDVYSRTEEFVKDGVTHIIKTQPEGRTKLNGQRPNPVGGVTMDSFSGPGNQYGYTEIEREVRVTLIDRLDERSRVVLVYTSNICYLEEIFFAIGKKWISRTFTNREEAKASYGTPKCAWVRSEPLFGGVD